MTDPQRDELEKRVQQKEKAARFWKRLSLVQMVIIALLLMLTAAGGIHMNRQVAHEQARVMELRNQAQQALDQAEAELQKNQDAWKVARDALDQAEAALKNQHK